MVGVVVSERRGRLGRGSGVIKQGWRVEGHVRSDRKRVGS